MPLVHRRAVPLLPPPNTAGVPEDRVFVLQETGEQFLDHESYSSRMAYLASPIFQCEFSGKSGLTYAAALESEKAESRIVKERFPDELKGRVLSNVQFQVMGRLDALVDLIYDRYKDRYFAGEKVFVDLSGDKYFARIAKVFPPAPIRALQEDDKPSTSASPSTSAAFDDYSSVCHKIGTDLTVDAADARQQDDPDEYFYTVQLSDADLKFEGSFMEVKAKTMNRDRLAFSKSILKRYIRECVSRDSAVGSPWIVKPSIAASFSIPTSQPDEVAEKNKQAKEAKLAKRRKTKDELEDAAPTLKKLKADPEAANSASGDLKPKSAPRAPKYPIEDLDLDPMSVHDGRVRRRTKQTEELILPVKPRPSKEMPVPAELFESVITTWNFLNVFSRPLHLSTFTLDDFSSALRHPFREPKCLLVSEIHSALVNLIGADQSRVFGSTGASTLDSLRAEATEAEGEERDELDEDNDDGGVAQGEGYSAELDALVRRGIGYARRWDRSAKLKSADGRAGWERHVIGAICQRGGPLIMPNLTRILAHLFEGADLSAPTPGISSTPANEPSDPSGPAPRISFADADAALGGAKPEAAYLTLAIEDKIDILGFLCALAMGSKAIRAYIDESETRLTELRKQRADVNKERKALLDQRAILTAKLGASINGESSQGIPAPTNSNGHARPSSTTGEDDDPQPMDDDLSSVGLATPVLGASSSRASSVDTNATERVGAKSKRQGLAGERKAQELAKQAEAARARAAIAASAELGDADKLKAEIDDQILANSKKDDLVEREFRRWQGVIRCRPLGKDRFFCRYWWFDGIGGMDLATPGFGTGRLFVQGPSQEDWDLACAGKEEAEMMMRRTTDEGTDEDGLVGLDEWAFYEAESELDSLQSWLNGKGTRELALKSSIAKWRSYIVAGSKKRLGGSTEIHARPPDARRSTRAKNEPEPFKEQYLNWTNALAKY